MKKTRIGLWIWVLVVGLVAAGPSWEPVCDAEEATPQLKPSLSTMSLSAAMDSEGRVVLTWDRPGGEMISGFRILRAVGPGGALYPVGVIPESPNPRQRFIDRIPVNTGYRFSYRVVGLGAQDRPLLISEPVEIDPPDHRPPARPIITSVTPVSGKVRLTWSPPSDRDLAGFNVYRAGGDQARHRLNEKLLSKAHFEDTSIVGGHRYRYSVTAVDRWGNESGRCKEVSTRGLVAFEPVSAKQLSWSKGVDGKPILTWIPIKSPDVRGYFVYRSDAPDKGFVNVSGLLQKPRYVDPTAGSATHWYRIRTVYRGGAVSNPSVTVAGRVEP